MMTSEGVFKAILKSQGLQSHQLVSLESAVALGVSVTAAQYICYGLLRVAEAITTLAVTRKEG